MTANQHSLCGSRAKKAMLKMTAQIALNIKRCHFHCHSLHTGFFFMPSRLLEFFAPRCCAIALSRAKTILPHRRHASLQRATLLIASASNTIHLLDTQSLSLQVIAYLVHTSYSNSSTQTVQRPPCLFLFAHQNQPKSICYTLLYSRLRYVVVCCQC
jgi:hypothetical protein